MIYTVIAISEQDYGSNSSRFGFSLLEFYIFVDK